MEDNIKLNELLEIPTKHIQFCLAKSNCMYESSKYDLKMCANKEQCTFKEIRKVRVDFQKPENFVKLEDIVAYYGFLEFEHNSKDSPDNRSIWDAYIVQTNPVTFKSEQVSGSGNTRQEAIINVAIKIANNIKQACQQANFTY